MSLSPGSVLGAHEIVGLLGAGGMGEVYRARDTKLNRQVAIKVLPEAYATDPDRVARFHREAQAIAALNHPNIATIYDLAESGATKFLVLELIEGDTLADRLRRGPVPPEEALIIIKQVLEALEAAHEKGICHRDLKPANIKITADGVVKVLDFGLAKFMQAPGSQPLLTNSPTLSVAGTYPGVILGTAGYMSPEQAKGYEADHRSDLFSVGCILYELLSGRQAFEGETASDILAGVLKSDVDLSKLPPRLYPRLVDVLQRCLEKNPKKRWHAAADVRGEIEAILVKGDALADAIPTARPPFWKRVLLAAIGAVAAAVATGYIVWSVKPTPVSAIARLTIPLPDAQRITAAGRQPLALSPDGSYLVYAANNRLFLRPLNTFEARPIAGTESAEGVVNPVFSPDGTSIAFRDTADAMLKRIPVSGGVAVRICAAAQPYGIHWTDEGIVWIQQDTGVMKISPSGGTPEIVAPIVAGEVWDSPQMLPGGRAVILAVRGIDETWDQARIVVQPLAGTQRQLIAGGFAPQLLATGHLAYVSGGVLMVVPFDTRLMTIHGSPVPIVEGIRRGTIMVSGSTGPGSAQFIVSRAGTLAYLPGPVGSGQDSPSDLAIFDRKGNVERLGLKSGSFGSPRVTRDGKWVAFESRDATGVYIMVHEIGGRSVPRRLTLDGPARAPLWSPDGEWVYYANETRGAAGLFRVRADGLGAPERLTTPEPGVAHLAQSFDRIGHQLLFSAETGLDVSRSRLWLLSVVDRKVTPFGDFAARDAAISPDGRWVAYGTRSATGFQLFVEPFPARGARYVLPQPGWHPIWSPKGDELLTNFQASTSATPITTTRGMTFGVPLDLDRRGRRETNPATGRRHADMMPDGRLIGAVYDQDTTLISEVRVVLNWFTEVNQRVPRH